MNLLASSSSSQLNIDEIWTLDCVQHGDSIALNEDKMGDICTRLVVFLSYSTSKNYMLCFSRFRRIWARFNQFCAFIPAFLHLAIRGSSDESSSSFISRDICETERRLQTPHSRGHRSLCGRLCIVGFISFPFPYQLD